MNSTMIFILLGLVASIYAFPIQNSSVTENHRFKRGYSGERVAENDMNAMDKILETNEYHLSSKHAGLTFKEGDIAVPSKRSAIICEGNSCLWPKSVDGYVYVPYIISPDYTNLH